MEGRWRKEDILWKGGKGKDSKDSSKYPQFRSERKFVHKKFSSQREKNTLPPFFIIK